MAQSAIFKSSIGKKFLMGVTGLFLISFLVIHAAINSMIWFNDGGETFKKWGSFMGTNPIIRAMELVLVAGFIIHIVDGLLLWKQNRDARPVKYAYSNPPAKSKWYSRSMGLLGTLLLIFLVIHSAHFWIPNRMQQGLTDWHNEIDLYGRMLEVFKNPFVVAIYVFGCISLFWHLLHGFKSAFQSLGINHTKYNQAIEYAGIAFSVFIPLLFALMPISIFFGLVN